MTFSRFLHEWHYRDVLIVLGVAIASLMLWRVPWLGWLFYPFHVFATFVHEVCHGIAAIITGGSFIRFIVNPNLSGMATTAGGIRWVVVSAGYVGSALVGGILIIIAASTISARVVLLLLGGILALFCLAFARNVFGFFMGICLAAGFIAAGLRLPLAWSQGLLLFLAVQLVIDSLNSVFDVVSMSMSRDYITTDAQIMATQTFIPAVFWSVLWSGFSIIILVVSLGVAYRRAPSPFFL